MERFLSKGRGLFLNYEHGFLHGPQNYNSQVIDPEFCLSLAEQTEFDGVFFNIGVVEHYAAKNSIIKLTSGIEGREFNHPITKICSVERALRNNALAVSITLKDVSSEISSLSVTADLIEEAKSYGLPIFLHATPKKEESIEALMHSARLALEMGADAVVLKYNFNPSEFKNVVLAAGKCRVIIDMDHVVNTESEEIIVARCKELLEQGIFGFSFGTSLLNHSNAATLAKRLRANL